MQLRVSVLCSFRARCPGLPTRLTAPAVLRSSCKGGGLAAPLDYTKNLSPTGAVVKKDADECPPVSTDQNASRYE
jgi:hypothetical protein